MDNYEFIKCNSSPTCIKCVGTYQPTCTSYKYSVQFDGINAPKAHVLEPEIEYNDNIHIYKNEMNLCLYFPPDNSWNINKRLYNTIIPWVHEWFVFYELYNITGKWEHPFVQHKIIYND